MSSTSAINTTTKNIPKAKSAICAIFIGDVKDGEVQIGKWLANQKLESITLILASAISQPWEFSIPYSGNKGTKQVLKHHIEIGQRLIELETIKNKLTQEFTNMSFETHIHSGNVISLTEKLCREYRCRQILLLGLQSPTQSQDFLQTIKHQLKGLDVTVQAI